MPHMCRTKLSGLWNAPHRASSRMTFKKSTVSLTFSPSSISLFSLAHRALAWRERAVEAMADLPCQDTVCAVVVGCVFAALLIACVGLWICYALTRDQSVILPHHQPASDCRRACCGWRDPNEAVQRNSNVVKQQYSRKSSPLWDAMLPKATPSKGAQRGDGGQASISEALAASR